MNEKDGLGPSKMLIAWFCDTAGSHWAVPLDWTTADWGEVPLSQLMLGSHPSPAGSDPSRTITYTEDGNV